MYDSSLPFESQPQLTKSVQVWLFSLPEYQGHVYEFDSDSHMCSTISGGVYAFYVNRLH